MKIFVDIDETICSNDQKRNYSNAKPIYENIKKVNSLYDKGKKLLIGLRVEVELVLIGMRLLKINLRNGV